MRWISRLLRRRPKPAPQSQESEPGKTPGQREAESALSRSRMDREQIQAKWPEVKHRANRIRREVEKNNFAELFRTALEGGRH